MKILLTGASGMVGRNLMEKNESFNFLTPSSNELDLLSYDKTFQYLKFHKPDFIVHAAGRVGGIQANISDPVRFLIENLDMGRNIVMAARNLKILNLLNLGSSCMYPRNGVNPLKEDSILKGELEPTNEGYALAKITISKLCQYITNDNNDFQYKTLIPCNLYGRWDKFDPRHSHMIPAVIQKVHKAKISGEKEVLIWGDGTARREFMYAGDLANCILKSISNFNSLPNIMNVGLGYDYSIKEYYETIANIIGFQGVFVYDLEKPTGMKQKLVDTNLQTKWGWKPETSLKDGISKTYNFYMEEKIG
ncbi:GDP-L-fucose synthase [Paenibacillus aurantius]|uniref:GDP-L-fucose synthase n=1 Tax=Paenibacillus aurantius TaxID=2918900 RepID=A0AA96LF16_9BACL|nr:GDP-L-fucose synthase [Paenibacillus aurantius]WNQ10427.1 GDP-L-fucose synthase [Paenibacillus aurantius]